MGLRSAHKKNFLVALISVFIVFSSAQLASATSSTTDFNYVLPSGTANWTNGQAFGDFYLSDGGTIDISSVTHNDMYDSGLFFEVCTSGTCTPDGAYTSYTGVGTANSTTGFYSGAKQTVATLDITAHYKFSKAVAAARMLVQIDNTTVSSITKQVRIRTNLGSDGSSYLKYQSSGGATLANYYSYSGTSYTSTSTWFITSDNAGVVNTGTGLDPVASFAFGVAGASVTPTTLFNNDNMYTMYTVTIPANSSRYLLVGVGMGGIAPLNNSLIGAYNGITTYLTNFANWPSDLTSDLTAAQTSGLLNWVVAPSVNSFAPRATTNKTGASTYDLVFSEAVTGLATGDFSFSGSSGSCSVSSVSGSGTTYVIGVTGCSEGTSILTLASGSITGTQSGPLSATNAATVTSDQSAPTISTLTAPSNATYLPGNTLTFTATLNETVTVTGTPRIPITLGSTPRFASYSSGSNSRTLTFTYTIPSDIADLDLDGITVVSPAELNSGQIQDLFTNSITNLGFTVPTTTGVLIAQAPAAPTITSITSGNASVSVAFTAGVTNGSAITNYKYSINNGSSFTALSPTGTSSPFTISGLTNGTSYSIIIRAVSAAGDGAVSNMISVSPTSFATVLISLTASATTATKSTPITITAAVSQAGRVTFFWNMKRIAGCINKAAITTASCTWRPNVSGRWNISATLIPTNLSFSTSNSSPLTVEIGRRSGTR